MEHHRIVGTTRRALLAGIAAALAPGSLAGQAQSRDAMRRLGVLMAPAADDPTGKTNAAALVQALGALNWHEGGNLRIDWRWAGVDTALFQRYAAELAALGPEVLVANSSPAVAALRQQATTIPIVFTQVTDPVGQGFVASLARPGGTITGFGDYDPPIAGKWLAMLTQITPPVERVAVLYNPATALFAALMMRTIEGAAPSLKVAVRAAPVHDEAEIEAMMAGLAREERGGVLVLPEAFTAAHRDAIVALAARYRVPVVFSFSAVGGLMSYGIDPNELFRRAAAYVDRILQGRQAKRPAGPEPDQVRSRDQSENRQGPRNHLPDHAARHRRRGDRVRRRTVLAGIAAALAPAPLAAQALPRRLGVLVSGGNAAILRANTAALLQALAALGWHDGGNLRIDWRTAGADAALFQRYAAELVALGPDVILAGSNPAVVALRAHTSTIPIVFVNVGDPIGEGYVDSLARPGGNITGFSLYDPPMAGKWLGLLTQISPPIARVAVLYDPSPASAAIVPMLRLIEAAGRSLAVAVKEAPVRDDAEIEAAIADLAREERGGLLVPPNPFSLPHRDTIVALAARYRVPAIYWLRSFVAAGGLMSYGIDLADPYRGAADYIDRILKGAKASDLPVQNPTKFELVLNLKTAKALGITIPTSLLATADEVIE